MGNILSQQAESETGDHFKDYEVEVKLC